MRDSHTPLRRPAADGERTSPQRFRFLYRWRRPRPTPRTGTLDRLAVERERIKLWLLILAGIVAILIGADLLSGGVRGRSVDLAFNLMYGACGSVLATLLVALFQIRFRTREVHEQAGESLRLLGVKPGTTSRVALVVTTWKSGHRDVTPRRSDGFLGPAASYPDELDDSIYVRRDMLLVADLMRLLQKGGLGAPVIVSDEEFLTDVRDHTRQGPISVYVGDGRYEMVTNVIVIGLWGNRVTEHLMSLDRSVIPFRLDSDQGQEIRIYSPDVSDDGQYLPLRQLDERLQVEGGEKVRGCALISRFRFDDVTVSILGGAYGLPTARLGDLLLNQPPEGRALWQIEDTVDFWAGIGTPSHGSRTTELFEVETPRTKLGQVEGRRFSDLLRDNVVNLQNADQNTPVASRGGAKASQL